MPLPLSAELLEKLRQKRARQLASKNARFDKFLLSEEVVLLYHGMGPANYIGLDGRIFLDTSDWCGLDPKKIEETNDAGEVVLALLVGARTQQLPELLDLLPEAPPGIDPCRLCDGLRWFPIPGMNYSSEDESQRNHVCIKCCGFGWENTAPETDAWWSEFISRFKPH